MSHATSPHVVAFVATSVADSVIASVVAPIVTSVVTSSQTLSIFHVLLPSTLLCHGHFLSPLAALTIFLLPLRPMIYLSLSVCCTANTPAPAGGQKSRSAFIGTVF